MDNTILFNPGQASLNLGDEIIEDACKKVLEEILDNQQYVNISTHLPISNRYLRYIKNPKFKFVLGSNLLMSNMCGIFRQWDIKIWNKRVLKDTILFGAGWHQYTKRTNLYTKFLYKSIFNKKYMHSVRDEYTKNKLTDIGIENVINTGCPTLWSLTKQHCKEIDTKKAANVIFTVTDYNRDAENDKKMINILKQNYKKIYFWPQGIDDYNYLSDLGFKDEFEIIEPNLKSYDELLEKEKLDFVGTRLHSGIRALQKKQRTIIISIDNRAEEMAKDYNLNIIKRNNIEELSNLINSNIITDIKLPEENIRRWKEQFKERNTITK